MNGKGFFCDWWGYHFKMKSLKTMGGIKLSRDTWGPGERTLPKNNQHDKMTSDKIFDNIAFFLIWHEYSRSGPISNLPPKCLLKKKEHTGSKRSLPSEPLGFQQWLWAQLEGQIFPGPVDALRSIRSIKKNSCIDHWTWIITCEIRG